MLVKRGNVEIVGVIKDEEHKLDDESTRKAMEKAKTVKQSKEVESDRTVES